MNLHRNNAAEWVMTAVLYLPVLLVRMARLFGRVFRRGANRYGPVQEQR